MPDATNLPKQKDRISAGTGSVPCKRPVFLPLVSSVLRWVAVPGWVPPMPSVARLPSGVLCSSCP